MLLQVTPSPTCSHACTGLQHLKNFQSFFVIFILGLFHTVDLWLFRAWCISAFVGLHNLYIGVVSTRLIHLLGSRREFLVQKADWVSIQMHHKCFKPTKKSHYSTPDWLFAAILGSWFALLYRRNVLFDTLDDLLIIWKRNSPLRVLFTGGCIVLSGSRAWFFEDNMLRRSRGRRTMYRNVWVLSYLIICFYSNSIYTV